MRDKIWSMKIEKYLLFSFWFKFRAISIFFFTKIEYWKVINYLFSVLKAVLFKKFIKIHEYTFMNQPRRMYTNANARINTQREKKFWSKERNTKRRVILHRVIVWRN